MEAENRKFRINFLQAPEALHIQMREHFLTV